MAEHDDVQLGMRVRDMHGELLGTVIRKGANRFLVQRGTVVKESLIVPDDRVAAINDGEVALNCGHRELLEAMRNPPMQEERARAERYRYVEMDISSHGHTPEPTRSAEEAPDASVAGLSEAPDKVRVVREELTVNPGSAREFGVRSSEEPEKELSPPPPDRPIH